MIEGVRLKVCGLTSLVDAELADACGADYLGFILYPKSPRHIALAQVEAMARRLPDRKRVAVLVEPEPGDLEALRGTFDFVQIHFRADLPVATVQAWSTAVGPERLWLAPKLQPGERIDEALLPLAKYVLLDTYRADGFGGTGRTGDWQQFAQHQAQHPEKTWILAGGLAPTNIAAAIAASGARFVDVNSGVEVSPGVKDPEKLRQLAARLREARIAARQAGPAPGR